MSNDVSADQPQVAIRACFSRYMAALEDPAAADTLYGLYAPDAPLFFRGQVLPCRQIPRAEFAYLIAARARVRQAEHQEPLRPALENPTVLAVLDDGDRAHVRFSARERVDGRDLTGAVGLVRAGDTWLVHWATLGDPTHWTWKLGRAQTTADGQFWEVAKQEGMRSWFDAAYFRAFMLPRPPLITLPDARFACQGSARCCNAGFDIELPPSAQAIVDGIDWTEVAPALVGNLVLTPNDKGLVLLKHRDETCRFLDAQKRCLIHSHIGRVPFTACSVYPLSFQPTPDGVVAVASPTCSSARCAIGPLLSERADDLYMRLGLIKPESPPKTFRLAPGQPVAWETFRAVEQAILDALANDQLDLLDRLWAGTRALHAHLDLQALPAQRPVATSTADAEDNALLADLLSNLTVRSTPDAYQPDAARDTELMTTLRSYLFLKFASFEYDLLTAWNMALYAVILSVNALREEQDLANHTEIVWMLGAGLIHAKFFERLAKAPEASPALRELFGQPTTGVAFFRRAPVFVRAPKPC